jgi:CPA2 family monovalent cation:H+ antiporter-2
VIFAVASDSVAVILVEIGAVALGLSVLARAARWFGITPIPLYLLAGLAMGRGGAVALDFSEGFISLAAEIGVLLLLLTLGLEYSSDELRSGLRSAGRSGLVDATLNFSPGFVAGLLLGWGPTTAALLGGVTWISSSGVISKVLSDFDRLGNRETPAVLNLLVIEDLAMAIYLPVVAAVIAGTALLATVLTVTGAVLVVALILAIALRWGGAISEVISSESDEALVLAIFGLTLLVGGLAQQVDVSAAIGAFLVGLALSGSVQERAGVLILPLRDLFAATFFFFFSFQLDPAEVLSALGPAALLALVATATKLATGWWMCSTLGRRARLRAGLTLVARGEFSIIIASLGIAASDGEALTALAAAFVLLTAVVGPVLAKYADRIPLPARPTAAAA